MIRARGRHFTISSLVFVGACLIVAFTSYHGHSRDLTFTVAAIVGVLVTVIPALVFVRPHPGGKPAAAHPAWVVPISILLAALTSALLPGPSRWGYWDSARASSSAASWCSGATTGA